MGKIVRNILMIAGLMSLCLSACVRSNVEICEDYVKNNHGNNYTLISQTRGGEDLGTPTEFVIDENGFRYKVLVYSSPEPASQRVHDHYEQNKAGKVITDYFLSEMGSEGIDVDFSGRDIQIITDINTHDKNTKAWADVDFSNVVTMADFENTIKNANADYDLDIDIVIKDSNKPSEEEWLYYFYQKCYDLKLYSGAENVKVNIIGYYPDSDNVSYQRIIYASLDHSGGDEDKFFSEFITYP